jgi:hypothetical protein
MCCKSHEGDKVKRGSQKRHVFVGLFPEALHIDHISALTAEIGDDA